MSLQNNDNEGTNGDGQLIQRTCWHINPMRAAIAKQYNFSDENYGEDWDFLKQVLPHLKSEVHTDKILTQYNHSELKSEADNIMKFQSTKEMERLIKNGFTNS